MTSLRSWLAVAALAGAGVFYADRAPPPADMAPPRFTARKYRNNFSARGDEKRRMRKQTIAKILAERTQIPPARYLHSAARRRLYP